MLCQKMITPFKQFRNFYIMQKYYTQIQLLSDYLYSQFNQKTSEISSKYDIQSFQCQLESLNDEHIRLTFSFAFKEIKQVRHVYLLQMGSVIKVLIKKEIKGKVYDQWWFRIKSFTKSKVGNSYSFGNIVKGNTLVSIFETRILSYLNQNIISKFNSTLHSNTIQILSFLSHKDFLNVSLTSTRSFKLLNRSQVHKVLYEKKYGKTGFDISQLNWKNQLVKKYLSEKKSS